MVARTVAAAQPWLFSERLAQRIHEVLDGLGVESWAVQPLRSRITLWSVREEDFVRAVEAVRRDLAGEGFYVRPLGARRIYLAERPLPDGIDSVRGWTSSATCGTPRVGSLRTTSVACWCGGFVPIETR